MGTSRADRIPCWRRRLISLNNGNDYVGSGLVGLDARTAAGGLRGHSALPGPVGILHRRRSCSEVSPASARGVVLRYEVPIAERFGLNIYGCCEPLHRKLEMLKRNIPRLRRVSISTWADKAMSAEQLGDQIIFNWKPNPAVLAGRGVRRGVGPPRHPRDD